MSVDVATYADRLSASLQQATSFMKERSYRNPISLQPMYWVRTVLPGEPYVHLATDGMFRVSNFGGQRIHTEFGLVNVPAEGVYLTPNELMQFIVDTAASKGSTSPSTLPVEGILEHLAREIEILPQVLALEMNGQLSATKKLLP